MMAMARPLTARLFGSREALIIGTVIAVAVLGAAIIIPYAYVSSREALYTDAEINMAAAAQDAADAADRQFDSAWSVVERIVDAKLPEHDPGEAERLFSALASFSVRRQAQLSAAYIGFPDGSFLLSEDIVPREVGDSAVADKIAARMAAESGFRRIIDRKPGGTLDHWYYENHATGEWLPADVAPVPYDPRSRPWYQGAVARSGPFWSDPYVFVSTRAPGIPLAVPLKTRSGELWGVVGVDIGLAPLSKVMDQFRRTHLGQTGIVYISDGAGRLLSHPELGGFIDLLPTDSASEPLTLSLVHRRLGDDLALFQALRATLSGARAGEGDGMIIAPRGIPH